MTHSLRVGALQIGAGTEQPEQHGHADGDTVGDLVEDHRAGQLAGIGDHLHAAVHRPRVHHQCMWCHACRSCGCEAVHRRVLVERWQQRVVHPLALHAQQVEHVEVGQQRIEVVAHLDGPAVQ
jgi:hypothetical protein